MRTYRFNLCLLLIVTLLTTGAIGAQSALAQSATPPPTQNGDDSHPITSRLGIGVNLDNPSPEISDFDQTREARFRWVRLWFWWKWLEPRPGEIDWPTMDAQIAWARQRNLKILVTFASIPGWANGVADDCDFWKRADCAQPPVSTTYYTDFVHKVVSRYRKDVKHWGVWNEPNLKNFWSAGVNAYIKLILEPGYWAIKSADPEAQVVGPDLSHVGPDLSHVGPDLSHVDPSLLQYIRVDTDFAWFTWLRDILRYGNGRYIDVIAHHAYLRRAGDVLAAMDEVKKIADRNQAGNKPVWLTETAWSTCKPTQRQNEIQQYIEINNLIDGLLQRSWVKNFFYFALADDAIQVEAGNCNGITETRELAYEPKLAYDVYQSRMPEPLPLTGYTANSPEAVAAFLAELRARSLENERCQSGDPRCLGWYEWNYYYVKLTGNQVGAKVFGASYTPESLSTPMSAEEWWELSKDSIRLGPPYQFAYPVE